MMEWTNSAWPDWGDAGKAIEIALEDGTIIAGHLRIDDWLSNGEDEVPIFTVEDAYGESHSFCDNERWRFVA